MLTLTCFASGREASLSPDPVDGRMLPRAAVGIVVFDVSAHRR